MNIYARPGVLGLGSALPQSTLRSLASLMALFVRPKGIRFQSHLLGGARKQLLNYEPSLQKSCRSTPVETPWEVRLQYFLVTVGQGIGLLGIVSLQVLGCITSVVFCLEECLVQHWKPELWTKERPEEVLEGSCQPAGSWLFGFLCGGPHCPAGSLPRWPPTERLSSPTCRNQTTGFVFQRKAITLGSWN